MNERAGELKSLRVQVIKAGLKLFMARIRKATKVLFYIVWALRKNDRARKTKELSTSACNL